MKAQLEKIWKEANYDTTAIEIIIAIKNNIYPSKLEGHQGNQSCGKIELNASGKWCFNWYNNFADNYPVTSEILNVQE